MRNRMGEGSRGWRGIGKGNSKRERESSIGRGESVKWW